MARGETGKGAGVNAGGEGSTADNEECIVSLFMLCSRSMAVYCVHW